jgi:hypothetical protein
MANMTVGDIRKKKDDVNPKMRSVTFTHTAAGTATGSASTTEEIHGTLLRIYTDDGGDASWNVVLSDGNTTIWTSPALGTSAQTLPLGMMWDAGVPAADTEVTMWGLPMAGQSLTCSTSNMSGSGVGPAITVIYRVD